MARTPEEWLWKAPFYEWCVGMMGLGVKPGGKPGTKGVCRELEARCNFIDTIKPGDAVAIFCPRDTLKTTLKNAWTVREICRNRNYAEVLGSENLEATKASMRDCMMHLEGKRPGSLVAKTYGSVVPFRGDGQWVASAGFLVNGLTRPIRENTVDLMSRKKDMTGFHYNTVSWDDAHRDENTKNPDEIKSTVERMMSSVDLLYSDGIFWVVGTFWDERDFYNLLEKNELSFGDGNEHRKWKVFKERAMNFKPDGEWDWSKSNYPQNLPIRTLKEKYSFHQRKPGHFAKQYMLQIINTGDRIFEPTMYRRWDRMPDLRSMKQMTVALDPALGDAGGDKLAWLMMARDEKYQTYVLAGEAKRIPASDFARNVVSAMLHYGCHRIAIPRDQMRKWIQKELNEALLMAGWHAQMIAIPLYNASKIERGLRIATRFNHGGFIFPPGLQELEHQVLRASQSGGTGGEDDLFDCLTLAPEIFNYPRAKSWLYKDINMGTAMEDEVPNVLQMLTERAMNPLPKQAPGRKKIDIRRPGRKILPGEEAGSRGRWG